jgi:hypothetical protein
MFDSTINVTSDTAHINENGGIYLAGLALSFSGNCKDPYSSRQTQLLTTLLSNSVRSEIWTDFRSPDETNNQPSCFLHKITNKYNNNPQQK